MRAPSRELREIYADLLRVARRCCRSSAEANDVVQDTLELALKRRFDEPWTSPSGLAWLRGVVRKRAAFLARGEGRRRRREQLPDGLAAPSNRWTWQPRFLASLPPGLRSVARLASADLTAAEIRWLLRLSDTAFRQRMVALRRAVRAEAETPTLLLGETDVYLGSRRSHLLAVLRSRPWRAVATHDPDGHAILLSVVPHRTEALGNSTAKEPPCLQTASPSQSSPSFSSSRTSNEPACSTLKRSV